MKADEVIESYVRDVARCLPRRKRNDVAFELRALLGDELAAKAEAAGRAPDKALAMDLLKGFGRPAEAAGRYHQRPAVIDATDTHHFLIWSAAAAITVSVLSRMSWAGAMSGSGLFLQCLGAIVVIFALMGWFRRRQPGRLSWRPKRGQDWMPRGLAVLAMTATLIFPVFMYAAPQTFVRVMFLGTLPTGGVELTEAFSQSDLRVTTMTLLILLATMYAAIAVQGGGRPWTGWTSVVLHGGLGLLLVAHAAPGTETIPVFRSAESNTVAMPIFGAVGAMLVLCALYDAYREWSRVRPAPALRPTARPIADCSKSSV
ncbi:MAG: hypothetical protein KIT24_10195 [Phycisphaeraceae bacterium]|nr:hypothetical protein [Phycisphaeraceae bacterium]